MSNNNIIKIILAVFFIGLFSFLFWYFQQNNITKEEQKNDQGFIQNFFPFGDNKITKKEGEIKKEEIKKESEIKKEIMPQLRQISSIPTAGVHIESLSRIEIFDINKNRRSNNKIDNRRMHSEIRYVSIRNNHIYRTYDFTKEKVRISNITIPKIFDVKFFNKDNFIIRYLNNFGDIKTYFITLNQKTDQEKNIIREEGKVVGGEFLKNFQGLFFPDNINSFYINKESQKIFYTIFENNKGEKDGKIYGIITTKENENKRKIFSSKLKEWNFDFSSANKILATTKTSSKAYSIPFSLNVKTGELIQLKNKKKSLNSNVNYDFSKILYSFAERNGQRNILIDFFDDKNNEEKILNLNMATFVEKCVWSSNNIYLYCAVPIVMDSENQPDDWYKGKNYFQDNIYKIDTEHFTVELVFDSRLKNKSFDIIDLKIDDREKYLYWIDKKTDFAWSFDMWH